MGGPRSERRTASRKASTWIKEGSSQPANIAPQTLRMKRCQADSGRFLLLIAYLTYFVINFVESDYFLFYKLVTSLFSLARTAAIHTIKIYIILHSVSDPDPDP